MNRILLSTLIAAALLAGCRKNDDSARETVSGSRAAVTVGIIGGAATKAAQTDDEAAVTGIQVFVFNGEVLDGYRNASSVEVTGLSVDVDATSGKRDIWAVCNAPSLQGIATRSELMGKLTLLADNSCPGFVMAGCLKDQDVQPEYSAVVAVDRYAARLKIDKITRKFKNEALAGVKMQITKIYLTSAVSNELYSFGKPEKYTWLNLSFGPDRKMAAGNPFVYQKLAAPASIAQGGSYTDSHSFYVYANENAVDDSTDPKTFKRTRLVVETQIDVNGDGVFGADEYYTYPVSVGAVGSNKSYEIQELVITRLGNESDGDDDADDGEDDDITSVTASVKVNVNDWTVVPVGSSGKFVI